MNVPEEIQMIREFCLQEYEDQGPLDKEDEQRLNCPDKQDWADKQVTIAVAYKLHLVNREFADYCVMQYSDRLKFNSMTNYEKMVGNTLFNTITDCLKDCLLHRVIEAEKNISLK